MQLTKTMKILFFLLKLSRANLWLIDGLILTAFQPV